MNLLRASAVGLSLLAHGTFAWALVGHTSENRQYQAFEQGSGDDQFVVEQGVGLEGIVKLGDDIETIRTAEVTPVETPPPVPVQEAKPVDELQQAITSKSETAVEDNVVKTEEPPPPPEIKPQEVKPVEDVQQPMQVALAKDASTGAAKTGGDTMALAEYRGKLAKLFQECKFAPKKRVVGNAQVRITVDESGKIVNREIVKSSGDAGVDRAALANVDYAVGDCKDEGFAAGALGPYRRRQNRRAGLRLQVAAAQGADPRLRSVIDLDRQLVGEIRRIRVHAEQHARADRNRPFLGAIVIVAAEICRRLRLFGGSGKRRRAGIKCIVGDGAGAVLVVIAEQRLRLVAPPGIADAVDRAVAFERKGPVARDGIFELREVGEVAACRRGRSRCRPASPVPPMCFTNVVLVMSDQGPLCASRIGPMKNSDASSLACTGRAVFHEQTETDAVLLRLDEDDDALDGDLVELQAAEGIRFAEGCRIVEPALLVLDADAKAQPVGDAELHLQRLALPDDGVVVIGEDAGGRLERLAAWLSAAPGILALKFEIAGRRLQILDFELIDGRTGACGT